MIISRRTVLGAGVVAGLATSRAARAGASAPTEPVLSVGAARQAAASLRQGTKVRVPGKGEYQVIEAAKAHLPPISGASFGLFVLPVSGTFIADHFGDIADAETAQHAISAACRSADVKSVFFGGAWSIESTVVFDDPDDVFVSAWGATFTTRGDILAFDFNGRADPSFRDNESRQNFRWHGGRFRCTAGLDTTAAAVRMLGFRSAEFYPEDFKGWDTDIITGGKDTVRIGNYKTFNCRISIEFPPWSTIGGPLMMLIENVHASLRNRHGKLVRSYVPLNDSEIRSFSCNLGPEADVDGAIDIERSLLLAVDSIDGKFGPGELIVGGTTGGAGDH